MKKFLPLLALVFVQPVAAVSDWEIVSDYDDTVKIANAKDAGIDTLLRAILSNAFFPGMSELYNAWTRDSRLDHVPLHFLSASPRQLRAKISEDLEERGAFPAFRLTLRNWFTERDTAAYKSDKLAEYLQRSAPLILLGDDTEQDPAVYGALAGRREVAAVYIRHIVGAPLPAGQRAFATAFDVAAFEVLEGRLSEDDALAVAAAESAAEADELVPDFVSCEGLEARCLALPLEGSLRWACIESGVRLKEICRAR